MNDTLFGASNGDDDELLDDPEVCVLLVLYDDVELELRVDEDKLEDRLEVDCELDVLDETDDTELLVDTDDPDDSDD